MADAVTTFKLAVKEVAREQDVFATFMPKPLEHELQERRLDAIRSGRLKGAAVLRI